jgi:hypothetical protein
MTQWDPSDPVPAAGRPTRATIAGILLIVFGVLELVFTLLVVLLALAFGLDRPIVYASFALLALAMAVQIVCGVMVLRRRRWAARAAIVVCAAAIVLSVVTWIDTGNASPVGTIALNAILIWLLANREVRAWLSPGPAAGQP